MSENDTDNVVVCPTGLRVRVRKLKVRQFKLLGNRRAIESGEVFEAFLAACATEVIDPGPAYRDSYTPGTVFDWKRALQGDRFATLLGIRRATHTAPFDFDVRCSACHKEYGWTIDLGKLPIVPYPKSSIEAFTSKTELSVDVAGHKVSFRLMTGAEEDRIRNALERLEKSDKRTRRHPFDPLIDGALARLTKVEPKPADLRDWYEDLDTDEMLKIGAALEATSGGIETTIETLHSEDPRCGGSTKIELPFGSKEFWIPRGPGMGSAEKTPNAPARLAMELGGDRDEREED